jgi:hypothetical protein
VVEVKVERRVSEGKVGRGDVRKGERERREIEGGRERGRESEVVAVDWAM